MTVDADAHDNGPHGVCNPRAKSLKNILPFRHCFDFPMLLRCCELLRSLIMLCCRCGIQTKGVELSPDVLSPICPACLHTPKQTSTKPPGSRRRARPGPPAAAALGRKGRTSKTPKKS